MIGIFLLEMDKNDICLGATSKIPFFSLKKYAPINEDMPHMSRTGIQPGYLNLERD